MSFDGIRDQDQAVATLTRAITRGRVPHAYLFEGPAGVGKRLAAQALAEALNCELGGADGCGSCSGCRKVTAAVHPDVRWLTVPEGKRRITIDSVREAAKWLAIRPHEGKAKLLIVEPAEQMSEQAANALLKTLEEPRPGSFLILVTAVASALLPTVRSRCQLVRFGALASDTVADILVEQGTDPQEAALAAALSEGSVERASSYLGEELSDRIEAVLALAEGALNELPLDGMAVAAALRGDRNEVLAVLELLLLVLDEVLWLQTAGRAAGTGEGLVRHFGGRLERIAQCGLKVPIGEGIAAVHRAITGIERNNMNPQLAMEGVLMTVRGHRSSRPGWARIGERR